jgi:AraC-like DNA-binding protein
MEIDLLSSIFMHLRLKASIQNVFDAGGRWAIEVPIHHGIKIHSILKGRCWISLADDPIPRELAEGDCYLLPRGNAFLMASDPAGSAVELAPAMLLRKSEGITQLNGGGDFLGQGLFFDFESPFADILFQSLPSLVVVSGATSQASELQVNIRRFASEFRSTQMGRSLILNQLAPVILVDLLRTYFTETPGNPSWFGAASESELSRVLSLMHTDYARRWTLDELASEIGMSRSKLAARFKIAVGIAPMEYLCRWRMEIARDLLRDEGKSLSEVSHLVGYDSESAFSSAFLRVLKCRPGSFQKKPQGRGLDIHLTYGA